MWLPSRVRAGQVRNEEGKAVGRPSGRQKRLAMERHERPFSYYFPLATE
jgi:hypothetical protein